MGSHDFDHFRVLFNFVGANNIGLVHVFTVFAYVRLVMNLYTIKLLLVVVDRTAHLFVRIHDRLSRIAIAFLF